MPESLDFLLTVRDNDTPEGLPVARLRLFDRTGDVREFDFPMEMLADLSGEAAVAWSQLRRGDAGRDRVRRVRG